ncbi:hypothetical protein [Defluviimonas sp. SAOS-178_SWC]|uniref:hypothetical protein n=1 Tax=Defluviimonas sp. SAOS-178_SWC TaxID=3121287 RepID=UPI00322165AE
MQKIAIIAIIAAMLEPARTIIEICGGVAAVARITGRSEIRVRRWGYPKSRGGSDGLIPSDMQKLLMDHARKKKLPLEPAHFFPDGDTKGDAA